MSAASSTYGAPVYDASSDPRRWLYVGLAVLFALIGLSVLDSVLSATRSGVNWGPWMMGNFDPLGWVVGLLLLILFLSVIFWIVRAVVWGVTGGYHGRSYYRHYPWWGYDSGMAVARERYARGEINREQFEQIATDLERRRAPGFP
ncbi:MAG TPA: hypothetical protein VFG07_01355 [Thermoplasmata archaeon]|nr:hypothetical protein [Thermoplasmata archaeon]